MDVFNFKGYKMYCLDCDNKFIISDEEFDRLLTDNDYISLCPFCKSIQINIIEVEGQRAGY